MSSEARNGSHRNNTNRKFNYFDYFTEIEDLFIKRRGKTLLLSPMDWALIESWKTKGIPLHVVLQGIETSFDSFARRPRHRTIKSLLYCQEEVEALHSEWLERQIGAASSDAVEVDKRGSSEAANKVKVEVDARETNAAVLPFPREVVAEYLVRCRVELTKLCAQSENGKCAHPASFCETVERVVRRLDELAGDWERATQPSAEQLEAALTLLERVLNEALPALFTAEQLAGESREAAAQLEPYRRRMEKNTYQSTLAHLLLKRLRDASGVPRLSLFHL